MVQAHFGEGAHERHLDLLQNFVAGEQSGELLPTDRLLNTIFLTQYAAREDPSRRDSIAQLLMRPFEQRPQP